MYVVGVPEGSGSSNYDIIYLDHMQVARSSSLGYERRRGLMCMMQCWIGWRARNRLRYKN